MLVSPAVVAAAPAGGHVSFGAWRIVASTPFIGASRNNFSHGVKILFQTLCPPAEQECFKANQALLRSGADGVPIQASRRLKTNIQAALSAPSALFLNLFPSFPQNKKRRRAFISPPPVWLQPYFALCLLHVMQNTIRRCTNG
jgi:hypothetical protein